MSFTFSSGTNISCTLIDIPAFVANSKPLFLRLSDRITVSLIPIFLNPTLINLEISFLFKVLLSRSKESPCGSISDNNALPHVVSYLFTFEVLLLSKFISLSLIRTVTFA